jgi:ABC-type Na+ transport system ATPase subunit NatA
MPIDSHVAPIEIHGLTKNFGAVRALDGLELSVHEGEVHGFLGPNGAGKSTTIRILLGVVKADGGTARLLGGNPWTDAVELHRQIAYVPGDVTLWPNLTGGETIDLLARMRGGIDEKRRAELIGRFELDPHKKARTYSKGNRQKVSLISAFSSRARLLLLDEPSSGLDPLMENIFQQCVAEARDRGASVLLSSHILAETEVISRESAASKMSASTEPRCGPTSTARASANSSGCSATSACAAWSANHPPWRNCSYVITAPKAGATSAVERFGHDPRRRRCSGGNPSRAAARGTKR